MENPAKPSGPDPCRLLKVLCSWHKLMHFLDMLSQDTLVCEGLVTVSALELFHLQVGHPEMQFHRSC